MDRETLVIFDYDGGIVKREYTQKCFKRFINSRISGVANFFVKQYTEGKLPYFLEAFTYLPLLYCLKGAKVHEIEEYVSETTQHHLIPGVVELIEKIKKMDLKVGIVSENIQFQPRYAAKLLNVDIVYTNEAEIKNGKLTGKILHFSRKREMVREIIKRKNPLNVKKVIYVGDDVAPYGLAKCILHDPKRKWERKKVDNKNCFFIKNYTEILPLIEKLYKS